MAKDSRATGASAPRSLGVVGGRLEKSVNERGRGAEPRLHLFACAQSPFPDSTAELRAA
jgi:hypothetical protein